MYTIIFNLYDFCCTFFFFKKNVYDIEDKKYIKENLTPVGLTMIRGHVYNYLVNDQQIVPLRDL